MDNRKLGLILQLSAMVLGLISVIAIVKQNPVVVTGLCLSAGLYFVGRYIKDKY